MPRRHESKVARHSPRRGLPHGLSAQRKGHTATHVRAKVNRLGRWQSEQRSHRRVSRRHGSRTVGQGLQEWLILLRYGPVRVGQLVGNRGQVRARDSVGVLSVAPRPKDGVLVLGKERAADVPGYVSLILHRRRRETIGHSRDLFRRGLRLQDDEVGQPLLLGLSKGTRHCVKTICSESVQREAQLTGCALNVEHTVRVRARRIVEDNEQQSGGRARRQAVGDGVGGLQEAVGLQEDRGPVTEQGRSVRHADRHLLVERERRCRIVVLLPGCVCLGSSMARHRRHQADVATMKSVGNRLGDGHDSI